MMFPFVSRKKYDELAFKLECLLCEATGSRLSKHTYSLQTMLHAVLDYHIESCDEAAEEAIKDYKTKKGRTNREYLSTLDSHALATWILHDAADVGRLSTQSLTFLTEWLDSEYDGWINLSERGEVVMKRLKEESEGGG